MNHQNLLLKLNQIVEQAQLTLQNPGSLTCERQLMIIALARFISTEVSSGGHLELDRRGAPPPLT
jgi:hypothetical protein